MGRFIWQNGKILPESEAVISVYDSALMFGDMVFEMTRSFNRKQFKLREHIERLIRSIMYTRIPFDMSIDDLEIACDDIQNSNQFEPDDEHRLMINVSRGTLPMYSETERAWNGTNIMITDFPLRWTVAGMGQLFDNGINAVTPSQRAIPASLLDPRVKSRSRMHLQMANIEVSGYEGNNNWPLLLDEHGYVTEGTGANFFIVDKCGALLTPHSKNILNGISRGIISDFGVLALEDDITLYDIHNAKEAFFTATPFCMLPVTSINGVKIGDGKVGKVYNNLLRQWSDKVGVDIKGQIQEWDKGAKNGPSAYKFK